MTYFFLTAIVKLIVAVCLPVMLILGFDYPLEYLFTFFLSLILLGMIDMLYLSAATTEGSFNEQFFNMDEEITSKNKLAWTILVGINPINWIVILTIQFILFIKNLDK